jgi:hypothetical protein
MPPTPPTETVAGRKAAAAKGAALPSKSGGAPRYPTPNVAYLKKAIRAVGRGKGDHNLIRRYLIRRANALGARNLIPDNWNSDGSVS